MNVAPIIAISDAMITSLIVAVPGVPPLRLTEIVVPDRQTASVAHWPGVIAVGPVAVTKDPAVATRIIGIRVAVRPSSKGTCAGSEANVRSRTIVRFVTAAYPSGSLILATAP